MKHNDDPLQVLKAAADEAKVRAARSSIEAEPEPEIASATRVFGTMLTGALREVVGTVSALGAAVGEPGDQQGPMMTVDAAGRMLGCRRTRVFELVKAGKLKRGKSSGRATMLARASVEALAKVLAKNKGEADLLKVPLGGPPKPGRRRGGA